MSDNTNKQLKSYTTIIYSSERKHPDIFNNACKRFLTESVENILLFLEKQNI